MKLTKGKIYFADLVFSTERGQRVVWDSWKQNKRLKVIIVADKSKKGENKCG